MKWQDDCWMVNLEGFGKNGRALIWGTILSICMEELNLEYYRYDDLLGRSFE
jgi:hypothetical protein